MVIVVTVFLMVPVPLAYADPWCDFLSIFGICYDETTVTKNMDAMYFTTDSIKISDQPKVKQIELSNIEDGSKIESVGISITTSGTGNCQLYLEDSILNKIPISENFSCDNSQTVSLNDEGKYAIENKIGYNDKIRFVVKSNGVTVDSTASIAEVIHKTPTYFAKVENGIVTNVIVADSDFISTLPDKVKYVETGKNIRGNFAGIGYSFDAKSNVFIPQKPYDSWILDTTVWEYNAPVPMPADGQRYFWDEEYLKWVVLK